MHRELFWRDFRIAVECAGVVKGGEGLGTDFGVAVVAATAGAFSGVEEDV